jgi:hypothetical protein
LTSPLSPSTSISGPPTFSSPPSPSQPDLPEDTTRRRSPLSDAEKLDKAFDYLRSGLNWSLADFLQALANAKGPVNTRRKIAFATAAYKNSEVIQLYFNDEDQP